MAKMQRSSLIIGNWKMYKTIDQALEFIDSILPITEKTTAQVLLAVPYTAIKTLADKVKETAIVIGAQNMNDASEGAFTGEVAAGMLKDAGAHFALIGHSERRVIFHETNAFINRKVIRALQSGLRPVLCVGENFDERQQNQTEAVLKSQLTECLNGVAPNSASSLVIAYEPVWAIGTGLAASAETASQVMNYCRQVLGELLGEKEAQKIPIVYGGSVSPQNAEQYLESQNIDGLLVGSASLSPESFAKIIALRQNAAVATKS